MRDCSQKEASTNSPSATLRKPYDQGLIRMVHLIVYRSRPMIRTRQICGPNVKPLWFRQDTFLSDDSKADTRSEAQSLVSCSLLISLSIIPRLLAL
jgi:hypothetical protein